MDCGNVKEKAMEYTYKDVITGWIDFVTVEGITIKRRLCVRMVGGRATFEDYGVKLHNYLFTSTDLSVLVDFVKNFKRMEESITKYSEIITTGLVSMEVCE